LSTYLPLAQKYLPYHTFIHFFLKNLLFFNVDRLFTHVGYTVFYQKLKTNYQIIINFHHQVIR